MIGGELRRILSGGFDRTPRQESDPVIGRELEVERVIQILSRRTKNNPVLIRAGVGKTAIVEGLARLSPSKVPEMLKGRRVVSLDLGNIVAVQVSGEFEDRLKRVLDEIKRTGDIICY